MGGGGVKSYQKLCDVIYGQPLFSITTLIFFSTKFCAAEIVERRLPDRKTFSPCPARARRVPMSTPEVSCMRP